MRLSLGSVRAKSRMGYTTAGQRARDAYLTRRTVMKSQRTSDNSLNHTFRPDCLGQSPEATQNKGATILLRAAQQPPHRKSLADIIICHGECKTYTPPLIKPADDRSRPDSATHRNLAWAAVNAATARVAASRSERLGTGYNARPTSATPQYGFDCSFTAFSSNLARPLSAGAAGAATSMSRRSSSVSRSSSRRASLTDTSCCSLEDFQRKSRREERERQLDCLRFQPQLHTALRSLSRPCSRAACAVV